MYITTHKTRNSNRIFSFKNYSKVKFILLYYFMICIWKNKAASQDWPQAN